MRTTPELCSPDELTDNVLRAESTLLAALLSDAAVYPLTLRPNPEALTLAPILALTPTDLHRP